MDGVDSLSRQCAVQARAFVSKVVLAVHVSLLVFFYILTKSALFRPKKDVIA